MPSFLKLREIDQRAKSCLQFLELSFFQMVTSLTLASRRIGLVDY